MIKNAKILIDSRIIDGELLIENGIITSITEGESTKVADEVYDAEGNYLLPGFIDIHTHGAVMIDVNKADEKGFEKISQFFSSQGTTSWLASILTDTREQTHWSIQKIRNYKEEKRKGAELIGIHLEGPFLAEEYKGAMPLHLLKNPDVELLKEYQEASGNLVRYMTISPELPDALEVIEEGTNLGIVMSMGHSGADYDRSMQAIEKGIRSSTHTFNAMKLMHQHFPAIMGASLESDVYCEAICDGRHLHPGVVRLLLKTKGWDKVVAITDSIMAAGLPDGQYTLGVNDIVVTEGDAKLTDGVTRAGSTLTMIQALKNIMAYTGRDLTEVSKLLSENPAKLIGVFERKGSIDLGKDADLIIISPQTDVIDTFVGGILQKYEIEDEKR
ncbi:N-acetylglucosamine-6-phosphate deacetylase [Proteiniclasticum sp. C24MP]|uniref:N-acetylglucosamine-6-phosphate deacetylase n=1 Tax=Proteiniclasticum sp. C24MP TaxID=3374101 RepID=UPI003754B36A